MKIALCFSGQPRAFQQGHDYYQQNLLRQYDVDVYVHSWSTDRDHEIIDLYDPVAYKFEPQVSANLDRYTRHPMPLKHPKISVYSMYYSMNQCRLLLEQSERQYDWVIRSRTDYALNTCFDFTQFDPTKMHIPDDVVPESRDTGNDQFAFSNQSNMIKYMSTFDSIDQYYDQGCVFNFENLMQANLQQHNLIGDNLVYVNMNNPFPPNQWGGLPNSLIRDDFLNWNARV